MVFREHSVSCIFKMRVLTMRPSFSYWLHFLWKLSFGDILLRLVSSCKVGALHGISVSLHTH
jgi:hypothetical protein